MDGKKRIIRNCIMIGIIVIMGASMVFAVNAAKKSVIPQMPQGGQAMQNGDMPSQGDGQQPPEMPGAGSDTDGSDSDSSDADGNSQGQPPAKPDGDNAGGNASDSAQAQPGDGQQPPEMPGAGSDTNGSDSDSSDADGNSQGQPPAKPDGDDWQGGMQGPPDMQNQSLSAGYYALFGAESLVMALLIAYLVCSGANSRTFAESFAGTKRKAAFIAIAVILAGGMTAADSLAATHHSDNQMPNQIEQQDGSTQVDAQGATVVDGDEETLNDTYTTEDEDTSSILVKNGGVMTLEGATVTKSGASTNTENSEFYGINAGILTTEGSTSTIKNSTIKTDADGSNAVFATGTDAKVYISDSTITTTGDRSARGLDATYGGYIEADNVTISTQGGSCASLATDRGEGTVKVTNSELNTAGTGSPLVYSTGDISVTGSIGEATGSQIAVIEGKNSATIENSTLTANGAGNRGDVDKCGVFIYQSMSGDASEGTGTFTATNSTLSISEDSNYYDNAPMFLVTNTDAVINLTDTQLNFGSGVLLNVTATDEWGTSGSNGGNAELTATNQTLEGDITVDEISTLSLTLEDGSSFTGSIDSDNTGKEVTLKLSADASIKLTGDTYLDTLEDEDADYSNIDLNGYKLYVNGTAI